MKNKITYWWKQEKYGVDYVETYAPVVAWPATRFFLITSLFNNWHT